MRRWTLLARPILRRIFAFAPPALDEAGISLALRHLGPGFEGSANSEDTAVVSGEGVSLGVNQKM
jgi:hypothetical protein